MATLTVSQPQLLEDVALLSTESHKLQERSAEENEDDAFNVLAKLKEFRDEGFLCDVEVQVNKKKFPAHRAVLAAWSPKITNLISSQADAKADLTLVLNYDNVEAFAEFIDYCYSGFVEPTEQTIHSLLDIGRNFAVAPLVKVCKDYLVSSLSSSNLVSRLITSVKYSLAEVEETVISYIETNLSSFVEQEELLNLRPQDVEVFLCAGKMVHMKPEVKFSLVINWVGYSLLERNKFLMYLLSQVKWDHTVGDLLIQISCTDNIFTSSEFCLFQLLQCVINSTGHHLGPFMTTYPRLYSMYSHMIDELTLPKVFSTTSSRIEDIIDIPVSVGVSTQETVAKVKDAEVNTDVDSSYFPELQGMHGSETPCQEDLMVIEISHVSGNTDLPNNEIEGLTQMYDNVEDVSLQPETENPIAIEESKLETTESQSKHRRKGRPRKISTKESKEKKPRGKSKKSSSEKETVKPMTKDPTNTKEEQEKGDNIKIEMVGDSSDDTVFNGLNVTEEVEPQTNDENTCAGTTDTHHGEPDEDNKTEEKPKLKLNVKLKRLKSAKQKSKSVKSKLQQKSCLKTTKKVSEIKKLLEKKPARQRFTCPEDGCNHTTRTEYRLELHIEAAHESGVKLQCRKCDFSTSTMRELCIHMKGHYDILPYYCDEPGCKMKFLRMSLLVRHQMTHMNLKPYQCDLCTKSFATLNQLRCHKKLHEGRQFECDICLKRFTTKGVMQQHRAIHFDNKPYLCDTCGFATKHMSHLVSHRKIHTGDVLRCSFPNCSYTTPKQGHMTQHVNRHLNIRNHICTVCGKSFVVRGKLLRHERIHLKEKLYKCKQCDYQTSRTDRMKLHIESHGIKFKKKTYNRPLAEEVEKSEIDFHQFFEKVNSDGSSQLQGFTEQSIVTLADMKPIDAISLAATASMIVDSYTPPRLMIDPISGEAVTSIEDTLATFQQGFERLHTTSFDQL